MNACVRARGDLPAHCHTYNLPPTSALVPCTMRLSTRPPLAPVDVLARATCPGRPSRCLPARSSSGSPVGLCSRARGESLSGYLLSGSPVHPLLRRDSPRQDPHRGSGRCWKDVLSNETGGAFQLPEGEFGRTVSAERGAATDISLGVSGTHCESAFALPCQCSVATSTRLSLLRSVSSIDAKHTH